MPLSILVGLLLIGSPTAPDPLAPVRAGKWRCGLPDPDKRTCGTIARYDKRPDGGSDVTLEGLMPETGIVIHYRVPLVVDHDALCITIGEREFATISFTKGGVQLLGEALARQRALHREAMASFFGKQVCSRDERQTGVFMAESYVDGERDEAFDKPVEWVDPGAGYTLGPLPGGVT